MKSLLKTVVSFLLLLWLFVCFSEGHTHGINSKSLLRVSNILTKQQDQQIQVTVSPSLLTGPSGSVTVQWSGVSNPSASDWIGIYSPSDVDITTSAPVKYEYANASAGYLTTGSGLLQMQFLNMHADYMVVFFRNGLFTPVAAASSNTVTFDNLELPMGGHLMLTENNVGEMRVSWGAGYTPSYQYVKWGTQSGVYSWTEQADSTTYTVDDLCGPPGTAVGWREPGYLYSAVMTNLEAEVEYYYIYGSDEVGWSQESSFSSPPEISPKRGVTLVAYGDMGQAETDNTTEKNQMPPSISTTSNVLSFMEKNDVDFVLHIGDISYAMGYSSEWDNFMYQVLPVFSRVPYMTCGGNHEFDAPNSTTYYNGTDSGGECGVPFEARFPPLPIAGTKQNHWYSFDYGNVHVLVMSTEHDFLNGSDQYNFIASDLQSVNRAQTPWVIFAGHRPMYIDSTGVETYNSDQPVAKLLRENLESLLVQYHVNLALWGHHHSYQRTCPVYQEKCGPSSLPTHVVIGMAGAGLSQNIQLIKPRWFEVVDDQEHGYTIIETTETTLTMYYYNNDNSLVDKFQLQQ